ncbi:sensor histidine kinase [Pseudomonas panipatensis]|uniref:histidine kinase n=1 Tax=Pseudomonas panipatensis TaxID=428992 RepID=A0A1G8HNA5_9PSED|nr:ATP-binding protein [Pseudomonas panipatensis]SDI08104.1 two-component system, OmpR family, sensor histidine kinase QseC [Pseudomonas panipatensis]SMP59156.1 two-component system, OmpR family, sensor histidine kinase QseC [Pseudomonas panipatensis]
MNNGTSLNKRPRRVGSLSRRLLLLLIGGVSLCWLLAGALTYHLMLRQVNRLSDEDMIDFGAAALRLVDIADDDDQANSLGDLITRSRKAIEGLPLLKRESALGYSLWYKGQRLFSTPDLPMGVEAQGAGFSEVSDGERNWRVLQLSTSDHNARIWIFENLRHRSHTLHQLLLSALFPLILALPLLALLVWLGVSRGLAPLRSLTAQIHLRNATSLHPLALSNAPVEVHSLVNELNLLLERLNIAMEAERRLTSDAAHEIRTPLASLRTHAQVALRSADPAVHAHGLQQVSRSVERISTLMEQILLLARLDNEELHENFDRVDLGLLSEETIADLAPQAIDKHIELTLENQGAVVMGVPVWLGIMLGNLVGNALRYTPEGGRVEIRLSTDGPRVDLWVRDSGPGVAPSEHAAIFTRFYRSPNAAAAGGGSGLGLPIVKRIVEIHHGQISLHPGLDGQGLGVRVELPSADGSTGPSNDKPG